MKYQTKSMEAYGRHHLKPLIHQGGEVLSRRIGRRSKTGG